MKDLSKVPTRWATAGTVPVGWMRQFRYIANLYDRIRDVPGDVVECGLGEGNTFAMLAYLVGSENRNPQRTLFGFDSFQGWPEPTVWDQSPRNPKKGEWKVSEEMVTKQLEQSGIFRDFPQLSIQINKGFLCDSLPHFGNEPIAILHLDVDLYVGYRDALQYLFPNVSESGIVAFDEYRELHPEWPEYGDDEVWPGCTKAVDEYFANRPEQIQYHAEAKKYYVVKGR